MKATELRIGNWFEYNGLFLKVDGIRPPQPLSPKEYADKWLIDCDMSTLTVPLDECKPIPLTEEWLERFGFDEDRCINIKSGVIIQVTMNFIGSVMYSINGSHWVDISDCQYVHQLQNLYFALTGQELQTDENDQKVNQ